MNPVFRAAAETIPNGWIMGVTTLFFLATFLGWAIWAWLPQNRSRLEAAARLPLDDGDPS